MVSAVLTMFRVEFVLVFVTELILYFQEFQIFLPSVVFSTIIDNLPNIRKMTTIILKIPATLNVKVDIEWLRIDNRLNKTMLFGMIHHQ